MNIENKQIYEEEKLNRDSQLHFKLVGDFCCGADDPLNIFLSDDAFDYTDEKQGLTYILMDKSKSLILAFYTSLGFERANEDTQKAIGDSYNEKCQLYVLKLD